MKFSRVEIGGVSNPEIVLLHCRVGQGPNFRAVRVFYLAVESGSWRFSREGPWMGHLCGLRVFHQRVGLRQVTTEPHCRTSDPSIVQ